MGNVLHPIARHQAHQFVALLWHEIARSDDDAQDIDCVQQDLTVFLSAFHVFCNEHRFTGFALLNEVRAKAERYYQATFQQKHHDTRTWAFFRFRLEMAMLNTISASAEIRALNYAYHSILSGLAFQLDVTDRPALDWIDPSRNTPF